jgi:hypothetical protein
MEFEKLNMNELIDTGNAVTDERATKLLSSATDVAWTFPSAHPPINLIPPFEESRTVLFIIFQISP